MNIDCQIPYISLIAFFPIVWWPKELHLQQCLSNECKASCYKYQLNYWLICGSITIRLSANLESWRSAEEALASVFCDIHGIIFFDCLQKGKTVTGTFYAALLDKQNGEVKKKPYCKVLPPSEWGNHRKNRDVFLC